VCLLKDNKLCGMCVHSFERMMRWSYMFLAHAVTARSVIPSFRFSTSHFTKALVF
jgi:hypothetical protein